MEDLVWSKIGHSVKLERDKALYNLKRCIAQAKSRSNNPTASPDANEIKQNSDHENVTSNVGQSVPATSASAAANFVATKAPFQHTQPTASEARAKNLGNSDAASPFSLEREQLAELAVRLLRLLGECENNDDAWETREGLFRAMAILLEQLPTQFGVGDDDDQTTPAADPLALFGCRLSCLTVYALTECLEPRIRKAASACFCALSSAVAGQTGGMRLPDELLATLDRLTSQSVVGQRMKWSSACLFVLPVCAPVVLESVEQDRSAESAEHGAADGAAASAGAKDGDDTDSQSDAAQATRGWRTIETSVRALADCVTAAPRAALVAVPPTLWTAMAQCFLRSFTHPNRYVREACFFLLRALLGRRRAAGAGGGGGGGDDGGPVASPSQFPSVCLQPTSVAEGMTLTILPRLLASDIRLDGAALSLLEFALAQGLADNWSQVRFAATTAAGALFFPVDDNVPGDNNSSSSSSSSGGNSNNSQLGDTLSRDRVAVLLPPLCLNRYYVAEGVRVATHSLWKRLFSGEGARALIGRTTEPFVRFYVAQAEAENHAVREAAARCIAELGYKVDRDAVRPLVPQLLDALLVLFRDQSWPVRDCACVASGKFFAAFPRDCQGQLAQLEALWFAHLEDNIWSVRENSALALADVIDCFDNSDNDDNNNNNNNNNIKTGFVDRCCDKLTAALPCAHDQPQQDDVGGGAAAAQAAKRARDNDPHVHTGQQIYSCGSLAPKLKRGVGCMDHGFSRPTEPWERSDGAVYLLRELVKRRPSHPQVDEWLGELARLLGVRGFFAYGQLLETVCKQLPAIVRAITPSRFFADHFCQRFVGPLFAVAADEAGSRLAAKSAQFCLLDLRDLYPGGPQAFDQAKLITEQQQDDLLDFESF